MRNAILAIFCVLSFAHASAADMSTPEGTLLAPVQALRNNDFVGILTLMDADKQAEAKKAWSDAAATPDAAKDAELNDSLNKLIAPGAVDAMMAELEPKLKEFNAQQVSMGLMMMGGMVAMNMAKDPEQAQAAQELQSLITDICAWLPSAGLNDPAKARKALEYVCAGAQSLNVKTAADLRALSLDEALKRCGGFFAEVKHALAVYGLNLDALLDSIQVPKVEGEGATRTATVQFSAFGKQHSIPVKMENKDGHWQISDSNIAQSGLGNMMGAPGNGTDDLKIDDPADDPANAVPMSP